MNLSIFAPTADQRYLLGEDVFLRTHFPMMMKQHHINGQTKLIHEDDLLQSITSSSAEYSGNRLWVLYGAPGSGKSELVRWLKTKISREFPQRSSAVARIARHELDVLQIVERFQHMLPDSFLNDATYQRWQAARQKSRTLTKMILLFALENLLDSDEIINALFYRLLNALEPHVNRILATSDVTDDLAGNIELIGKETWQGIIDDTALDITLEYEQFRHQLTTAFRDHLLAGVSLPGTMQRISTYFIQEKGVRPILLVDDLVQSLNIFATDILDYLLTLEAGQWDVVIGVTPAAFEDSERGRTLLQRITYLDTIDDRVEKLWLSDEVGQESYILTEQNCHEFANCYLKEYEKNQIAISLSKLFFNREVLVRIYRGLPYSKGKARYFVRYLHEILLRINQGEEMLSVLLDYAQIDYVARVADKHLARVCELYGPLLTSMDSNVGQINLPTKLLQTMGVSYDGSVFIEPLVQFTQQKITSPQMIDDEEKAAVRDWLLGKPVNRQLLQNLRRGTARWLRTVQPIEWLHQDHVAKPSGILRWRESYLGINIPIYLEGVDDDNAGIILTRDIGLIAFDLHNLATATGKEMKHLRTRFAAEPVLASFLFSAIDYRRHVWKRLENQLGMSLNLFALSLYTFALAVDGPPRDRLPGFPNEYWAWLNKIHQQYRWQREKLTEKTLQAIYSFFSDFFEMRQNLYDGEKIRYLLLENGYQNLIDLCGQIDTQQIDKTYRFGNTLLKTILTQIKECIERCSNTEQVALSENATRIVGQLYAGERLLMTAIPITTLEEIQILSSDIYSRLYISLSSG